MSLPSTHTQVDMAIIQGSIAYEVAQDHARRGCDPGVAARHGALVGQITLAYWLFVFIPSLFWTFAGLLVIHSPIFLIWFLGMDFGALILHISLKDWRQRPVGSKTSLGLSGKVLTGLWLAWAFSLLPILVIAAVSR
jgi:hypothetical protein